MNLTTSLFFILGAPRAGTTSLYYYLLQHPQIYIPPEKELYFFVSDAWKPIDKNDVLGLHIDQADLDAYLQKFDNRQQRPISGDATTWYLYHPAAAARIHHYFPEAKMMALLRNPIERAYSHYQYNRQKGREPLSSFEEAIEQETNRQAQGWKDNYHYIQMGYYFQQIQRYLKYFKPEQLRFYLYEDIQNRPKWLVQDIFNFLNLPTSPVDVSQRINVSGEAKLSWLSKSLQKIRPIKDFFRARIQPAQWLKLRSQYESWQFNKTKKISNETKLKLINQYAEDIQNLQTYLQVDLSHWLKP